MCAPWSSRLPRDAPGRREPETAGDIGVARVGAQPVPARVVAHVEDRQGLAIGAGPLEPRKGLIPVAQAGVDERHIVRPDVATSGRRLQVGNEGCPA